MRLTDTEASISALAKICCTGKFNYYIVVEDEDCELHTVCKFTEGSRIEDIFKKMNEIKESDDSDVY